MAVYSGYCVGETASHLTEDESKVGNQHATFSKYLTICCVVSKDF